MRLRQRTQSVSYAELDDTENDTPVNPTSSKGKSAIASTPRRKKHKAKDDEEEEEEDEFVAEAADDQEQESSAPKEDDNAPVGRCCLHF